MMIKLSYIGVIIGLIVSFAIVIIRIVIESKKQSGFLRKLSISLQIIIGGIIQAISTTVVALFVIHNFLQ